MPIGDGRIRSGGRLGDEDTPGDDFYRFLRSGHVLRSLLREFLEEDFLQRVCRHRLTRSQFCFLKLITANANNPRGVKASELYNLTKDPGEKSPVAEPVLTTALQAALARAKKQAKAGGVQTGAPIFDAAAAAELEARGQGEDEPE